MMQRVLLFVVQQAEPSKNIRLAYNRAKVKFKTYLNIDLMVIIDIRHYSIDGHMYFCA